MEENEAPEGSPNAAPTQVMAPSESRTRAAISPQTGTAPCPTCGAAAGPNGADPSYVYALGRIEARFPSPAVEKEFAQATGRAKTNSQTDREAFHAVLSQRENRYLVRQLCWILTIQGLETYLLQPRDPADLDLLLGAIRPAPSALDIDAVIGLRGPMAPPEMCNGLMVPIVAFDQIYSFDREALIGAIPRPEKTSAREFKAAADELFDRVMQLTDNAGATDDHRALNYLAMRYPAIYTTVADAYRRNASLTGVEVHPSALSGTRNVVEVIFTFTNRNTDVDEKFFVRVDVTEEFPFLVTKMSQYYDR
jgi:cyclic patellamide precursor peptide PatG